MDSTDALPELSALPARVCDETTGHVAVRRDDDLIAWALAYGRACAEATRDGECTWSEEDPWGPMPGTYESTCGESWSFTEGGVAENGVRFCHSCGKPVKVRAFERSEEL